VNRRSSEDSRWGVEEIGPSYNVTTDKIQDKTVEESMDRAMAKASKDLQAIDARKKKDPQLGISATTTCMPRVSGRIRHTLHLISNWADRSGLSLFSKRVEQAVFKRLAVSPTPASCLQFKNELCRTKGSPGPGAGLAGGYGSPLQQMEHRRP
jgi:hypothetical protein